jgi:hypothetical protein
MEQVFELIEREAVDPEGVQAVLERCPECRASFEQMKLALQRAGELLLEEPPIHADAAILRAARERSARKSSARHRWLAPPPWAVAAAALLAVGIGVWAIPRAQRVEHAPDAVGTEPEPTSGDAPEPRLARDAKNRLAASPSEASTINERRATRAQIPEAPARAKRKSRDDSEAPPSAKEAESNAARSAVAGAPEGADLALREEAPRISAECEHRLTEVERREADADTSQMEPEDLLATGRCYQEIGDLAKARRWLRRAATHPETKKRAERALRRLPAE